MKEITLSNKLVAFVDDEDYEKVNYYRWWAPKKNKQYYPFIRCLDGSVTTLAEFLVGKAPEGYTWDHKDRNSLNNQKENLRLATPSQQSANRNLRSDNTFGYRGVAWWKSGFVAEARKGGKMYRKGPFPTLEEAAKARDELVKKLHGEFAVLNFPII